MLSPSTGPSLGGTVIQVAGTNLVNGSNYTCLFDDHGYDVGHALSLADPEYRTHPVAAVYGTLHSSGSYIRCVSPRLYMRNCNQTRAGLNSISCAVVHSRTGTLDISPNGQDYAARGDNLPMLTQYRPPAILSISPNTGPSAGGTRIVLHGVHNLSGGDDYRCRFVVNGTGLDGFGRNTTLQGTGLDIIASGDSGSGSGGLALEKPHQVISHWHTL